MKKYIWIFLILLVMCMGTILDTDRMGWSKPAAATSSDDTLVTADPNGMKYADIGDTYSPSSKQNGIEIAWVMDANDSSCVAYLFAIRKNGDIALVWTATLTAGAQQSTSNEYYVDTISSITDNWITPVGKVDYGGNNRMARIMLDTCGYDKFFFQYTGLSSETVQAYISGY